ncbi:MAG: DUF4058 family protein [Prochloron sp. SP5CPC1]|nr:DUF4058 family protein [Candidatus Paraprochloron terpiosi SP5CPC1]
MAYPFPGMNPYLEDKTIWPQVHKWLMVLIAEKMNPQLRPQYRMGIEERVYISNQSYNGDNMLVGIPDNTVVKNLAPANQPPQSPVAVAEPLTEPVQITIPMLETIKEWYLEVRGVKNEEVVTVIEILSPKNKRSGGGYEVYQNKRQQIFHSSTNLIEIDLLRQGKKMNLESEDIKSDYSILVSRSQCRPLADLYRFNLRDVIPNFPLPLLPEDRELTINLQELLHLAYDRGSFDLMIDYQKEPVPALSQEDQVWADSFLSK